jgi:hypothetical protein
MRQKGKSEEGLRNRKKTAEAAHFVSTAPFGNGWTLRS